MTLTVGPNSTAEVGVDGSDNHSNTKGSSIVEANSKTRMEAHSTSSTPASRKNPKQVQTNQANVIQSTPTAQSTKYKPVNAHSRNRAEISIGRSKDKTPDKNNKKKHYIYQYETRVTFKINVSLSDDPQISSNLHQDWKKRRKQPSTHCYPYYNTCFPT